MPSANIGGFLRDSSTGALMVQGIADRDNGQAGLVTPTGPVWAITTQALAASTSRLGRFVPSRDMTVVSMAFSVTTAASLDDAVDVGIYSADLATLLSHSGATTGKVNSVGAKTIAIPPVTLRAGTVYYAALSCGAVGGTAAVLAGLSYSVAATTGLFGTTAGLAEVLASTADHPLAAAPATIATATAFLLALRET